MRIQVLFNETSILVPCGDGNLTVKELVDKAIVRFKKLSKKPEDEVIEVHSVRLADSGSFVAFDDEVADVLEDKEVVMLEFGSNYIDEDPTSDLNSDLPPAEDPIPSYTSGNLGNEDHAPYSGDLHDPLLGSTLPNIEEDYDSSGLGIANGDHQSHELHSLQHLDDPTTTPTSLRMGEASQDIDMVNATWHSQNSNSQSPHMSRKTSDWPTSLDTGYNSKSQDSYSQSQPKSQETFHHSGGPDALFVGGASSGEQHDVDGPSGHDHHNDGEFPTHSPHHHHHHRHTSSSGSSSSAHTHNSRLPPHQQHPPTHRSHSHSADFGSPKGMGEAPNHAPQQQQSHHHGAGGGKGGGLKSLTSSYGGGGPGLDDSGRFRHSQDTYSPVHPPPGHHGVGGLEFSPLGRNYDAYHGYGYGGYPLPSLDEGGGALYDKPGGAYDHFKRRPMSMYNPRGVGSDGMYHTPPYGTMPPSRHMMGHYPGRPGFPPDMYDMRHTLGRMGGRPLDHTHYHQHSRLTHTLSHEKLDGSGGSSSLGGGARSRQHPLMGRGSEEDFPGPAMDMFLSQPTTGYFNYEQPPAGYGMHMMGPMYGDPRMTVGGPTSGVSLSQPGVMLSHRPHSMIDMDPRLGPRPHMGGASSQEKKSGSVKSAESLERAGLSIDDFEDIDPGEEDSHKGPNPFQRDFRKSIFRDGSVYANWMDRVVEYNIQDPESENDVPEFDGERPHPLDSALKSQGEESAEEGAESGMIEEDDEYGNIHIVELHKCDKPLGVQLTHYTSAEDIDVGVYIASIDPEGFAAKSGKLQVQDRILACNGVDFTKDMSNSEVEQVVLEMIKSPMLKMAVSRGGFKGSLQAAGDTHRDGSGVVLAPEEGVALVGGVSVNGSTSRMSADGSAIEVGVAVGGAEEGRDTPTTRPTIKTVAPPAAPSQAASLTRTNTRQIGRRHTITLQRGSKGFGFGLTSRDVKTDEQSQPIYVKVVHHGGAAYQEGQLRIGDRILEVNGVDVCGLSRPEVVQLLKSAQETVTLVISRQEEVEEQDEENPAGVSTDGEGPAQAMTVNKTVLNLEIPLHNCGPAGLGVTVYTKTACSKGRGEMGVYIKSIVAGGAAAMDGRLHKNDQVLSVNQQNLLGYSNQEAMDILKQAMSDQHIVQLVVARRTDVTPPSMAALGEEPEEEDVIDSNECNGHEVGIDVPAAPPTSTSYSRSSSVAAADHNLASGGSGHNLTSGSGHSLHKSSLLEATALKSSGSGHNLLGSGSQSSLDSRLKPPSLSMQTSLTDVEPSRGSMRDRAATLATSSPSRINRNRTENTHNPNMHRSQDVMGSGEFYDRLEPLPPSATSPGGVTHPSPAMFSHFSSLYDEAAGNVGHHGNKRGADQSNLDRKDMTSLDQRGMSRPNNLRSHPPHMSRDTGVGVAAGTNRHPLSPSDIEYQLFSPTGSGSSRENTITRQHQRNSSYDSRTSSYPSDSASSVGISYTSSSTGGMTDTPIRGSGRKDRNRPERGSGRSHASHLGDTVASPDLVMNGYATLPRSGSTHRDMGATPTSLSSMEAASLENLRLDDAESNMAFRRDNPGRISITKKTKKNPRQDFAHLHYDNATPLVEGEKPALMRAGSDSFLNEHNGVPDPFMEVLDVGPSLGLAKSSSLESLHNVMHHTIKRDLVDDGSDLRNRSTRNSFRQAVDRSYEAGSEETSQRGVDVDHDSALISFTKSPHASKTKKKGFFQKVFKKRKTTKKDKASPAANRKARGVSMEISPASLTAEERDQLMRHYTLQLRPGAQAGGGVAGPLPSVASAPQFSNLVPPSVRHSMPVLDDYDSPDSPDEMLLASMAKV